MIDRGSVSLTPQNSPDDLPTYGQDLPSSDLDSGCGVQQESLWPYHKDRGDYVTTSDGKRIVDHENIQRSRLRVDARKWAAARLAPKKYGDHISHDVKGPGANFQPAILITVDGQPHDELRTAEQRGRLGSE